VARQADAVTNKNFWLLYAATIIAGYYSVNTNVYHFAAAEIANPAGKGKRHLMRQPVFIVAATTSPWDLG